MTAPDCWSKSVKRQPAAMRGVQENHPRPDLDTPYVAPKDEIERAIAAAWAGALGLDCVGVDDNYFELGGDSLMAIQLMTSLSRTLEVEIGGNVLFAASTVAALALEVGILKISSAGPPPGGDSDEDREEFTL